ncbi:MAG TPA: HlyD family efflux transporter periplasmic adaptor subunit [Burkholderiales bacterium]
MTAFKRALLAVLLLTGALGAAGHEDHDHKKDTSPVITRDLAPRAESSTPEFALLATLEGTRLVVYLDRFATNEPVGKATLEIEQSGQARRLAEVSPGTYAIDTPWLAQPGRHALVFTVEAAGTADLLDLQLEVPAAAAAPEVAPLPWRAALVAFAVLIAALVLWRLARRRRVTAIPLVVATVFALGAPPAPAHQGEDHGAKAAAAPAGATTAPAPGATPASPAAPARLGDGSVFVSKPSQRQLGIRTQRAEPAAQTRSVELAGRVVPDPNAGGRVQASQSGRIEPGPKGLPLPGRAVARGEILAWLRPAVSSMDRAGREAALAELTGRKRLAEQQLERYRQLEGSIPQRRVDEVRIEIEFLAKGEIALSAGIERREALVAPVAGIVSASHAVAGQVVEARDVLFEIVDPRRLMVEALAYDPALARDTSGASAPLGDTVLALEFAGAGLQLREQAVPLLFRIRPPVPALGVGQTLKVHVATREQVEAVRVPRSALSGGAEPTLWIHVSAERFMSRKVRTLPLDATHVAVVSGLARGERYVVEGASVLGQVR